MTGDALARLLAGLSEDEQLAQAALGEPHTHESDGVLACPGVRCAHDVHQNPARVLLGELPLKRLILRDHRPQEMDDGSYCIECSTSLSLNIDEVPWPCEYIRALAGIYAEPTEEAG